MEARSRHLKKKYNSVSHNNEILSHNNDLVSRYIEKLSRNNEKISHNNDLVSHNNDLVSRNNDLVSHNNDLVFHNNDLFSHYYDLVYMCNGFHFFIKCVWFLLEYIPLWAMNFIVCQSNLLVRATNYQKTTCR